MKYLKKFSTEAEREAATLTTPNVSEVVQSETTHYDRAWSTPVNVITQTIEEYVYVDASLEQKNVNFWDYDGVLKYSYTDTEFLALTAMPENPSHPGLVAQGWNWSIENAKAYVTKYRYLEIGQQYTTTDGHTRIYITIPEGFEYMEFMLRLCYFSDPTNLTINWGDGSASENMTVTNINTGGTLYHTYSTSGSYMIDITPPNNITFGLGTGGMVYGSIFGDDYYDTNPDRVIKQLSCVTKVEIGNNVNRIEAVGLDNLETITITKDIIRQRPLPNTSNIYQYVSKLKAAIMSQAAQYYYYMAGNTQSTLNLSLKCYCFSDTPTLTIDGNIQPLLRGGLVKHLTIPESLEYNTDRSISTPLALEVIIYPDTWTTVIVPGYLQLLKYIHFPIGLTTFTAFYGVSNLRELNIPSTLTSLPQNAFNQCRSLEYINVPEGITSLGNSAFGYPTKLKKASLPTTLTTIGTTLFQAASPFYEVYIYATTPPTLSNVSSFPVSRNRSYNEKKPFIHVPPGTLNDYQTATTWVSIADYIEEMTQAEYDAYCTEHGIS